MAKDTATQLREMAQLLHPSDQAALLMTKTAEKFERLLDERRALRKALIELEIRLMALPDKTTTNHIQPLLDIAKDALRIR